MSYFICIKVRLVLEVSINHVRPLLVSVTVLFLYFKMSISFIFIVFFILKCLILFTIK